MHSKKIQFVTNCCVLHLAVIWAKDLRRKGKDSSAEKVKICQYFNRAAADKNIMEGATGGVHQDSKDALPLPHIYPLTQTYPPLGSTSE